MEIPNPSVCVLGGLCVLCVNRIHVDAGLRQRPAWRFSREGNIRCSGRAVPSASFCAVARTRSEARRACYARSGNDSVAATFELEPGTFCKLGNDSVAATFGLEPGTFCKLGNDSVAATFGLEPGIFCKQVLVLGGEEAEEFGAYGVGDEAASGGEAGAGGVQEEQVL